MLPTNSGRAKDQGCNPVSSNCVVWQGPDLDCIGLCKGDTISDVVAKMATELCDLVEMFDLGNFDFTCLNIPSSETPSDMGGLIQILIDRICALEGIDPGTPGLPGSDCPQNCIVPIDTCFQFIDPGTGNLVTDLPLLDYVNLIGTTICDILDDITALQASVASLDNQVNGDGSGTPITNPGGIVGEITDINLNKTDNSSLDYLVNTKTDPGAGVQFVTDALRFVENSLIASQDGLGSETLMYQNILKEGLIGDEDRVFGSGPMSAITGWTSDPTTIAESLGNAWLAIDDLRQQVNYMKENCCSTGCADIFLNFRVSLAGSIITLFTDGSTGFTPEWAECTGTSKVTVTDELGNSTTITTSLIALIEEPLGFSFDLALTSVDFTTNLTAVADTCFINTETETQCNQDYTDTVINSPVCPSVVLTVFSTSVNYQFTSTAGFTYIANVYYAGGGTPVASQIIATPGVIVIQSIMGLLSSTDYEFELIVVDGTGTETACPRQPFTTLADDCQPPINAVAIVTI